MAIWTFGRYSVTLAAKGGEGCGCRKPHPRRRRISGDGGASSTARHGGKRVDRLADLPGRDSRPRPHDDSDHRPTQHLTKLPLGSLDRDRGTRHDESRHVEPPLDSLVREVVEMFAHGLADSETERARQTEVSNDDRVEVVNPERNF